MNRKGLTLIEIMITVAIIGLIAAIAIPNFARSRQKAFADVCALNLKCIEEAKSMFALDTGAAKDEEPTEDDLAPYMQQGFPQPVVAGALYTIGTLVQPATCSVHSPNLGSIFAPGFPNSLIDTIKANYPDTKMDSEEGMWYYTSYGRIMEIQYETGQSYSDGYINVDGATGEIVSVIPPGSDGVYNILQQSNLDTESSQLNILGTNYEITDGAFFHVPSSYAQDLVDGNEYYPDFSMYLRKSLITQYLPQGGWIVDGYGDGIACIDHDGNITYNTLQ